MLLDFFKSQEGGGGNEPTDLVERWGNLGDGEKELVETVVGRMPTAWLSEIPLDEAIHYSARDADATLRVDQILSRKLREMGLDQVCEVDTAIIPLLNEMMKNGMKVDVDHFNMLSTYYELQLQSIHEQIADLFPGEREDILGLNLGSSDTLIWLLYDKLKLTPPAFTKKENKPSTASEDLSKLKSKHPVAALIIKYNEMKKLKTSFVDAIPKLVRKDGRVHPQIKATRVVTGRLSMAKPNLMQIPSRSEEAENIKRGFVAEEGYVLVSCDLSNIEMRVLAHESQDERMLGIFYENKDMHTINASLIFGVSEEEVNATKENKQKYRYPAKTIGFGVVYGLTAEGLVDQLESADVRGYTKETAQKLIDQYFGLYPGVKRFFTQCQSHISRDSYAHESCLGRIRRIPGVKSSLPWVVEASLREGMAQGIIKLAMCKVMEMDFVQKKIARPLVQIHDSLMFEVREECAGEFAEQLKSVMEQAYDLIVPVTAEYSIGKTWADC